MYTGVPRSQAKSTFCAPSGGRGAPRSGFSGRQAPAAQEVSGDLLYIAMLAIDSIVQLLHFRVRDLVSQFRKDLRNFGVVADGLLPDHRDSLIRREIVPVVFEHEQIQRRNEPVSGVTRGEIDLMIVQGPSQQTEVHHTRRLREAQAVGCRQATISV